MQPFKFPYNNGIWITTLLFLTSTHWPNILSVYPSVCLPSTAHSTTLRVANLVIPSTILTVTTVHPAIFNTEPVSLKRSFYQLCTVEVTSIFPRPVRWFLNWIKRSSKREAKADPMGMREWEERDLVPLHSINPQCLLLLFFSWRFWKIIWNSLSSLVPYDLFYMCMRVYVSKAS